MQVKLLFPIKKNKVSTYLSSSRFFIIFGTFLEAFGFLLEAFWSLCRLFGVLVSSLQLSLACLDCLWARAATFCGAFGSSGLSVGSGTVPGPFVALFLVHFGIIFGGIRGWN